MNILHNMKHTPNINIFKVTTLLFAKLSAGEG
jgi:hypothetical protein